MRIAISSLKRINETHPGALKIPHVSRDQGQVVFQGGRCQQTIGCSRLLMGTKRSPSQGDGFGNFQHHPDAVRQQFFVQPLLNHCGLWKIILGPQSGDSIGDLAKRNNADVKPVIAMASKPPSHIGVSPLTAAHFRQDVGVQKIAHSNETALFGFTVRLRTGSKSKPRSPSARRWSIKPALCPSSIRSGSVAAIKSCRASSDRERPFCAARASIAATTLSSRFSINSFVMLESARSAVARQPGSKEAQPC